MCISVLTELTGLPLCSKDNGGCQHLCVWTSDRRICKCKDGYISQKDGAVCLGEQGVLSHNGKDCFPGGSLVSIFTGYVPLAFQNPYPILVYFWSIFWPIIGSILVTIVHCSPCLVYFVANYRPGAHPILVSHFWANDFLSRKSATPFWQLYIENF